MYLFLATYLRFLVLFIPSCRSKYPFGTLSVWPEELPLAFLIVLIGCQAFSQLLFS